MSAERVPQLNMLGREGRLSGSSCQLRQEIVQCVGQGLTGHPSQVQSGAPPSEPLFLPRQHLDAQRVLSEKCSRECGRSNSRVLSLLEIYDKGRAVRAFGELSGLFLPIRSERKLVHDMSSVSRKSLRPALRGQRKDQ